MSSSISGRILRITGDGSARALSADEGEQLYIPRGFAHGFLTLSSETIVSYKVDAPYSRESEAGIRWNDPELNVRWPLIYSEIVLSEKDALLPLFNRLAGRHAQEYQGCGVLSRTCRQVTAAVFGGGMPGRSSPRTPSNCCSCRPITPSKRIETVQVSQCAGRLGDVASHCQALDPAEIDTGRAYGP